jgi:alpha-D-xyloside xylohydrolase
MRRIFFLILILFPVICQGQVVKEIKQMTDRVVVTLEEGTISISPLTKNTVRIKFYKDPEVKVPELIFTSGAPTPRFNVNDSPSKLQIKMAKISVALDKSTGKLSFADNSGKIFLSEKAGTRKLIPGSDMGEPCFMAEQSFESPADEYLFGLGQFQDGQYNIRSVSRRLTQVNSQISLYLFKQRIWITLASVWPYRL